jgi:hypothetical protein
MTMSADQIAQEILERAKTEPDAAIALATDLVNAWLSMSSKAQGEALLKTTKALRRMRAFTVLEGVCEAAEDVGMWWGWPMSHHAQALIERGDCLPALSLLQRAREVALQEGDTRLFADAWCLEGRAYKDLFTRGARRRPRLPAHILKSFAHRAEAAYAKGFRQLAGTPEAHYPAINRLAVGRLAAREGFSLETEEPLAGVAEGIILEVSQRRALTPESIEAWDLASAGEAAAYLGRWGEASEWMNAYLEKAGDDAFALAGTLRQFELLYGEISKTPQVLDVLDRLKLALIKAEGGAVQFTRSQTSRLVTAPDMSDDGDVTAVHQKVSDVDAALEKVWGAEGGISHRRLEQVMRCARAVGRVMMQTETSSRQTIGSGFLLPGELASSRLKGEVLFLTNAHVVSDHYAHDAPASPGEAWAAFDAAPELGEFALDQLLWSSGPPEHDVSIFKLNRRGKSARRLEAVTDLIKIAEGLPHLKRKRGDKTVANTVYIIGYPLGGELSYSMRDNELIDHENVYGVEPGPEPRRIHYRTPTEKGNSGSPIFNARTLELIGIHHAGGSLTRLNGNSGKYDVNEGLWIRPLLNAFRLST